MPPNKTVDEIHAQVAEFIGGSNQFKWRVDTSTTPDDLVLEDTVNNVEIYRNPLNTTIDATLENGGKNELNVDGLSGQLADPQTVSVEDGGTAVADFDTLNFTTNLSVTDAGSGQGDVSASGASNLPNWSKDGSQTTTATSNDQFTLSGTYDEVMVRAQIEDVSSATNTISLRANGDSNSNYDRISVDGTVVSGDTEVQGITELGANDNTVLSLVCAGRWSSEWTGGKHPDRNFNGSVGWINTSITSPLDSLTFDCSGNIDVEWDVYGRDIGSSGEA